MLKELKARGYKSFQDLSEKHGVHKDYVEFFAPVCQNLDELILRMISVKTIPIWDNTKFTGLNPKFDKEAKEMGYKNLYDVAKKYEKWGYDSFYFCVVSAKYESLADMMKRFDRIHESNKMFNISDKRYVNRVKLESRTHMKMDQVTRMAMLRIFLHNDKVFNQIKADLA